jgi:hypothetical protein
MRIESSGQTRQRRVMAGEGLVTPRKRLTLEQNGLAETLIPRRDRLAVDHEFVARHPEWFEPSWREDKPVRAELRAMLTGFM